MRQKDEAFQRELLDLKGKPAWGLVRSYGSMFFLEIGEPLPKIGEKRVHGEWHCLVEMCHWRIDTRSAMLIGSDDEQELIDRTFAHLDLGFIESVEASSPSYDLRIAFSSGIRIGTFLATSAPKQDWTQWQLFTPDDNVWIVDATGSLLHKSANA
jgi:hypothetical protein